MTTPIFSFILYGIVSEVLYLCFYAWYFIPQQILKDTTIFNFVTVFILFFLCLIYVKACKFSTERKLFSVIFVFATLFNISLFFSKPLASVDLYTYIYQARIHSKYHENPYLVPYSEFTNDIFYPEINNSYSDKPAVYGPVFLLLASGITYLGGENLVVDIYLFFQFFDSVSVIFLRLVVI